MIRQSRGNKNGKASWHHGKVVLSLAISYDLLITFSTFDARFFAREAPSSLGI